MMQNNVFIGVGQFGNYVARELEKLDFKVFYINSAREDLERIGALALENTHLIKGAKGFMKDRDMAKEVALENMKEMINQINSEYSNEPVLNFIFSLGGGTGSGVTPTLMKAMKNYFEYKTINIIVTTPHEEDITIDGNASICLTEIEKLQISGVINSVHKLSNDKFSDNVAKVNSIFASAINRYNKITEEIETVDDEESEIIIKGSEGDTGEFNELFNKEGNTVMIEFEHDDNPDSFSNELSNALNKTIYAPWIKDCKNLGFYTTPSNQNQNSINLLTSEFGIPLKTHTGLTKGGTFIIATGMSWNKNIQNKLAKQSIELENRRNKMIEEQRVELSKEKEEDVDIKALKSRLSKNSNVQSENTSFTKKVDRRTTKKRVSGSKRLEDALKDLEF